MAINKDLIRRRLQGIPEAPSTTIHRLREQARETGEPAIGVVGKTRYEVAPLASVTTEELLGLIKECPDKEFASKFKLETYQRFSASHEWALNKRDILKLMGEEPQAMHADKDTSQALETSGPSVKKEVSPDDPNRDFSRNPREEERKEETEEDES